MQELLPVPDAALDPTGLPRLGAYAGALATIGLDQARTPGLGALAGPGRARAALRRLRRKRWRWIGAFQEDLSVVAAVVDLGYIGAAWACVAKGDQVLFDASWRAPAAAGIRVRGPGEAALALAPRRLVSTTPLPGGEVVLTVEVEGLRLGLDLLPGDTALSVVSDVGRGSGLPGATVKRAGCRVRGAVEVKGERTSLDRALAVVDWTEAYFPRRVTWWWGAAAGLADGKTVGLNLAAGVHDDPGGRWGENALWLDGVPSALPAVSFGVGEGRTPWTIRSADGAVDLVFSPRAERGEQTNLLLIASRYRQPFGTFSGTIKDAAGRIVRVEGLPGVAEHHVVTW